MTILKSLFGENDSRSQQISDFVNPKAILAEIPFDAIYAALSDRQKDDLYRKVWEEHVLEDVQSRMIDLDIEDPDNHISTSAAHDYVRNGDYDCNCSYWDNIDALINRYNN